MPLLCRMRDAATASFSSMNPFDFGKSFLQFTTDIVHHTPRLAVDAICTIRDLDRPPDSARKYYLSASCLCENMYQPADLIQKPVSEFNIVAQPGEEYLIIKRSARAGDGSRQALRIREQMTTHRGTDALSDLQVTMRQHAALRPITSYSQFRTALLENRTINGRSIWQEEGREITLDYPAKTVNISRAQKAWQVDAGPLLVARELGNGREIMGLHLGYVVFNSWDRCEISILTNISLEEGGTTSSYGAVTTVACRNELFEAGGF